MTIKMEAAARLDEGLRPVKPLRRMKKDKPEGKPKSMTKEDLDLILGVKQIFGESEDTDALYREFEQKGISKASIDEILALSEDDVAAVAADVQNKEDEKAEILSLLEGSKIKSAAADAFVQGRKYKNKHTSVDVGEDGSVTYSYRGNQIAKRSGSKVEASMAGWPSVTTRAHLNAISRAVGGKGVGQRKGKQYHGDDEIADSRGWWTMKEDFDPEAPTPPSFAQQIMAAIVNDQPATAKDLVAQVMVDRLNDYVDEVKENLLAPEYQEVDEPEETEDQDIDEAKENLEEWGNQPLANAIGKGGLLGALKKKPVVDKAADSDFMMRTPPKQTPKPQGAIPRVPPTPGSGARTDKPIPKVPKIGR